MSYVIKDFASEDRFHVEVHFSPGAYNVGQERPAASWMGYRSQVAERKVYIDGVSLVVNSNICLHLFVKDEPKITAQHRKSYYTFINLK